MYNASSNSSYSSSRERERGKRGGKKKLLITVAVVLGSLFVAPLSAYAIQNIFLNGKRVAEIQMGGKKVCQIQHQGQLVYEDLECVETMQSFTSAKCNLLSAGERVTLRDARDDNSYYVKKIGTQCWMLTNLAYAGGGTNTYGDTKSISNGESASATYTTPYYYIPTGSNVTTGTTNPSTSTSGTGQYGYLYNWCAAMGAQTSTSACTNATTPTPDTSISICPSGWRLPTGGPGGDFTTLNTNANSDSISSDSGLLSNWYAMYSGRWVSGFSNQGSSGYYWSSTPNYDDTVHYLRFNSSDVYPRTSNNKQNGYAVRCLLK